MGLFLLQVFLTALHFVLEFTHLYNKPIFKSDLEMIAHGLLLERPEGLVLEFGVFSGRTINHISDYVESSQIVYGFDSFDGLPEDWRNNFQAGTFAVNDLPNVKENIRLIGNTP
jgi:hypothetical protein